MRVLVRNFDNPKPRRDLHLVWESICERGQIRLISRWVTSEIEKTQDENADATSCDEPSSRGLILVSTLPKPRRSVCQYRSRTAASAA